MTSRFDGRYAREFIAGWGTMDFNGHMANTAYLNLAADVPPPGLLAAFAKVPRAPGFAELSPPSKR